MEAIPADLVLLVLAAALMHAAWNAMVKAGEDRLRVLTGVTIAYGLCAWVALPFLPFPDPSSLPFIVVSAAIHQVYRAMLVRMYEVGDLGQTYGLARGTAPLLVALAMSAFGEVPSVSDLLALGLITGGIVALGGAGGDATVVKRALLVALPITAYTLVDGLGARQSGAPVSYAVWLAAFDATVFTSRMARRHGLVWLRGVHWPTSVIGGLLSLGAYAIALYAVTRGAVGVVAALRETSVLFAAVLGSVMFHEPFGRRRLIASAAVALGLVLLQVV